MIKDLLKILNTKQRLSACLIMLIYIALSFLDFLSIGLVIPLMEIIQGENSKIFNIVNDYIDVNIEKDIYKILFFFFVLVLLKNILFFFATYYQAKFIIKLDNYLQIKIFKNFINKDFIFYSENHSANTLRNLTSEVALFTKSLLSPLLTLVSNVVLILFILSLLLLYDFKSTLIITSAILFIMILLKMLFSKTLKNLGNRRQVISKEFLKIITESFHIVKEIKLLKIQKLFEDNFSKKVAEVYKISIKRTLITSLPKSFYEIIFLLILIFIIIANIENTSNLFTTLGVYAASIFRIIPSANAISSSYNKIKFAHPTLSIIKNELKNEFNKIDEGTTKILFNKKIQFENINFNFKDKKVFSNLNLQINIGDKIGIMGPSGSGKTTLINILMGLIHPESGKIKVDAIDIKNNISCWQNLISYVPQNVMILDESLKLNICLNESESEYDHKRYEIALEKSQLKKLFAKLEFKDETKLGENGSKISQGEKQRIGIARAIYRNSKLLILDESASSLDSKTKDLFFKELKDNFQEMTIVFISHEKKSLEICDTIYTLNNNRIEKIN